MDYSKVKFKYGKSGALEGWYEGKKIGEVFTMGDNVVAGEKGERNDGWVTMSGLHVLIDDKTGQIASGPLKGKAYTPVLQTKKQKSEQKKAAKAAHKAITGGSKGSSAGATGSKGGSANAKQVAKAKATLAGLDKSATITVNGVAYKKVGSAWVGYKNNKSVQLFDDKMADECMKAGAKNVKVSLGVSSKAVSDKLTSLPAGAELTIPTKHGNVTRIADGKGGFTSKGGSTDTSDNMAAVALANGIQNCKLKMPAKTQNTSTANAASNTAANTAKQQTSAPSLQSTLQQNAKTMKLAQFKQSMKSGMDAATPGTKVDWGGKTYQKQSDGSWQYVDSNGKTHQTSAKQIAHLATLKGGNGQTSTTRTQAQATAQATNAANATQNQTGSTGKGVDANGNIVSNVGTTNGKQKVMGKVTPNANLKKITNDAGDHQVAEGKDITRRVKIDTNSKWSAYEQIVYQQGYKNPPQTITDKATFDKMVKESGIVMFRAENTLSTRFKTGKQIIGEIKNYNPDKHQANWGGGTVHGKGIYFGSNQSLRGVSAAAGERDAKISSLSYLRKTAGCAQYKATLQKGAKIISEDDAIKLYAKAYNAAKDKMAFTQKYGTAYSGMRYNASSDIDAASAYVAAKGYDAVQWNDYSNGAYTMVFNVSKLVIYDKNEVER